MGSKYVPLTRLVADWARQSGELEGVILTRLCEHEAGGRIPSEAFRHGGTGGWPNRGALSELITQLRFPRNEFARLAASRTLDVCVVSKAEILAFCRAHVVRPPLCIAGSWRWLRWRGAAHEAPPPFEPTAEELEAARSAEEARRNAELASRARGHFNSMQHIPSTLRGETTSLGRPIREIDRVEWGLGADETAPIPWARWDDTWESHVRGARAALAGMTDADRAGDLRRRLEELEAEYAATKASLQAAEGIGATKQRRGRPPEAGSFRAADAPLVEEMRKLIEADPTLAPTAAAMRIADRAAGGGTLESKARRLAGRYAAKFGRPDA